MKEKRTPAKETYIERIIRLAYRNGGAVKLEEAALEIGKGKTYAWKLLQELVKQGVLERGGYGLYLLKKPVEHQFEPTPA
jgi:Mn-dependent DtxR family transcriptional regulator